MNEFLQRLKQRKLVHDPNFFRVHYYLGEVLQFKGRLAEAIPEYQKALDLNRDPYSLGMPGQAYARNDQKDEAQKVLAELNQQAKSRYVAPYAVALVYLGRGQKERALDDLRGNPRFEALVKKITGKK